MPTVHAEVEDSDEVDDAVAVPSLAELLGRLRAAGDAADVVLAHVGAQVEQIRARTCPHGSTRRDRLHAREDVRVERSRADAAWSAARRERLRRWLR